MTKLRTSRQKNIIGAWLCWQSPLLADDHVDGVFLPFRGLPYDSRGAWAHSAHQWSCRTRCSVQSVALLSPRLFFPHPVANLFRLLSAMPTAPSALVELLILVLLIHILQLVALLHTLESDRAANKCRIAKVYRALPERFANLESTPHPQPSVALHCQYFANLNTHQRFSCRN